MKDEFGNEYEGKNEKYLSEETKDDFESEINTNEVGGLEVEDKEVENKDIKDQDIKDQDIKDQDIKDQDIKDQDIKDQDIKDQDIENKNIETKNIENQDIEYQNIEDKLLKEGVLDMEETPLSDNFTETPEDTVKEKNKKIHLKSKILRFVALAFTFGIIAGISFQGFNLIYYVVNPQAKANIEGNIETDSQLNTQDTNNKQELERTVVSGNQTEQVTDVSDVVASTMPSIVSIKSTDTQQYQDWFGNTYDKDLEGSGSGIIVGKNETELLIVTNNHVVQDAETIKVTFIDEVELTAEVKGTDATADLAVVAIRLEDIDKKTFDKIKVAVLGNSENVKVGQMAIAIGNALGYGQSVTVGYISAKDRTINLSEEQTMVLLQTDAAINPGNSGGALLNINGEVIGINSVKYASDDVEGMGYAIPISKATPIINDLMKREIISEDEQGYLGITGDDVTSDVSERYNMPLGVYVNGVAKNGAAEEAGILSGDIITSVNGIAVQSITALKEKVNSFRVGTKVTITFMRSNGGEYTEQELVVELGQYPQAAQINSKESQTIIEPDSQDKEN